MTSLETPDTLVFGIDGGDDDSASFGTVENTDKKDFSIFDDDVLYPVETSPISESVPQFFFFTDDHSAQMMTNEMCKSDLNSYGDNSTIERDAASRNTPSSTMLENAEKESSTSYSCKVSPSRTLSFCCEDDLTSFVQCPEPSPESFSQVDRLLFDSLQGEQKNVPPASVSDGEDRTLFEEEFVLADDVMVLSDLDDDHSFDCDFDEAYLDLIFCLCREACDAGFDDKEKDIDLVGTPPLVSNQNLLKEAVGSAGLIPAPNLPPAQANGLFLDGPRQCLLSSAQNEKHSTPTKISFPLPADDNEVVLSSLHHLRAETKASGDQPQELRQYPICATPDWPLQTHTFMPSDELVQLRKILKTESTLDDWIDMTCLDKQSRFEPSLNRDAIRKDESCAVPSRPTPQHHQGAIQDKKCARDGEHPSTRKEKVIIYELTENDYLTGRGGHVSRQPCNQRIREMIRRLAPTYSYHGSRAQKSMIVEQVIADIHAKGGRVLERDPETYGWTECSDDECRLKVSQRFREEVARARRNDG